MNAGDIGSVQIAAAFGATMSISTAIFMLLQIVKAFVPNLHGRMAEVVNIVVSAAAVSMALVAINANWMQSGTWLSLIVGTLSATVVARGIYAQLFKTKA